VKLVHAADLHLDSPLVGLDSEASAPVARLRLATRHALANLVDLCLEEEASLLLLAGDLWDGEWRDYSTGLHFAAQMARLARRGVHVVWLRGNHDAESRVTRHLSSLPERVRELSTRRPESVELEDLGIAVHGQGFATRAVTDSLVRAYPEPRRGLLNIGLLHTSVDGREGHDSYAPCSLSDLVDKGYDYWALGHVHRREVLCQEPFVVFPGNVQGRHARETGEKGATLVHVEDGRIQRVEPRALDVVRWAVCEVSVEDARGTDEVLDRVADALRVAHGEAEGRLLATRVVLTGRGGAHAELSAHREHWAAEVKALALNLAPEEIWIEKVRFATRPELCLDELRARDDVIGQVLRGLDELRSDDDGLVDAARDVATLARKLVLAGRTAAGEPRFDDAESLRALLDDVEAELLPRLLGEAEP
jgi:exonuclease SbcD